jgi:hypothetical protein
MTSYATGFMSGELNFGRVKSMSEKIKNARNRWSDGYYSEKDVKDTTAKLKDNPIWAFPPVVQGCKYEKVLKEDKLNG